ncbi:MAG: (Fe-S)-binding protein, partial [Candidatus Bathyarchaeia archaeon]
ELYNLMPKLDCGLCGNPSCQTTARKIATGDSEPEECLPFSALPEFKENLQKIRQLLHEGIEIGAKGRVVIEETGITYIHPCITEARKVAAEARLTSGPEGAPDLKYGFYDPLQLCAILSITEFFQHVKCSPSLGIGRVNVDDKTVLIYKDGRINVRKARDKEDAVRTIRRVSRSLWGAIICTCGNASVDCASGGCQQCLAQICPVMSGGPPDPTVTNWSPTQQTITSTIFERVKTLETRKLFEEGMKQLDEAFNLFKQASPKFLKEHSVNDSTLRQLEKKIVQVNKLAIRFIVKTSNVYDAAFGLILSGVAMDLSRIVDGLKGLTSSKSEFSSPAFTRLLSEATNIAVEAYSCFRAVNLEGTRQIASRYEGFRKQWMETFRGMPQKDLLIAIEKIAVNGFYISRLLTKPLPI